MRLEFIGDAWEPGVGFTTNMLFEKYPCRITGTMVVDSHVYCDLYTTATTGYVAYL